MFRFMSRRILLLIMLIIPVLLCAGELPGKENFTILSESPSGLQIKFSLPAWELKEINNAGAKAQKVVIGETPYLFLDETETLPIFSTLIAIPNSGGASIRMIGGQSREEQLFTADFDRELSAAKNDDKQEQGLYPKMNFSLSEPQILRDMRIVSLNIYPFQYDQQSKRLIVKENIELAIDFNSTPSPNEMVSSERISPVFDQIYQGMILNYNRSRDVVYENPVLLVIYGNYSDATYLGKVNEYVAWKRQKGFIVNAVSTATTGTSNTAIKAYIQNVYNNINTRPDYIVLIGDDSGTIAVPSYNTYIDYYYTWLAGSDNLGDVLIGRISVDTTQELVDYLGKIRALEQNINVGSASWLNKMVLVGDTASSGISTIYTNRYISDVSTEVNPSYTYTTVYGGSPSSTTINAAINQGVAFYNYRGYIGMSGWPSSMSSMANGNKLFHAVFITCNTGSFGGGTATTEQVVRYGTEASLGGSVTAIGMATSSTHTPMNNCLNVGIFHGIYPLGMRDMGSALLVGKLYLNSIYGVSNATQAYNFAGFCNLMGDPTATVYVGIPKIFSVNAPATIASGTPEIRVDVDDNLGQPVEGASVTLVTSTGTQITGFSNEYGYVILTLPATLPSSFTLTVSKNDYKPSISTITTNTAGGIVYDSFVADDDTSTGNGDGLVNPGEEVELYVTLLNSSASTQFINAEASCDDPYVTMIDFDRIEFDDLAPGAYGENTNPIIFSVAANCPDGHQFVLSLAVAGATENWVVPVPVIVHAGRLEIQSWLFQGAPGNIVNPGNALPLSFTLRNSGSAGLAACSATLISHDSYFVIQDSTAAFNAVGINGTVSNIEDAFQIYARGTCIDGMVIPLELRVYNASGYSQSLSLSVTIGQTTVTDPLGQDAYGYFIFDQGDMAYEQCPTYSWLPIAPAEGGSGTLLNLSDPGNSSDEGDQVGAVAITTVNLPFTFNYYGVHYTQASISSNGFISFGSTLDADWRNWRLPGPGGPNPMIAVFWDDLDIGTGSGVYTYYNSALHYYVVEWYSMVAGYDSSTRETFQAILYDPLYYPTITNDGQIKLQYKLFNNIDLGDGDTYPHGNYSTIGIKDHNGTVGLEYTFNNTYPTAAAPLANERALFITTRNILSQNPHLTIQETLIIDANNNNHLEKGESAQLSIQVRNSGLTDATGVTGVLSSSDPYVTITTPNASYGNIPAQGIGAPLTNFAITVAPNCPAGHEIVFTISLYAGAESWIYNFPLGVYEPELEWGDMYVHDSTGDNDGNLDPGETCTLTIVLNNNGEVASPSGVANLSCSTYGITVTVGTVSFGPVPALGHLNLNFTVSAAASMNIGTLANFSMTATAGSYTVQNSATLEVGAPTLITIGTGTATQSYPIDRYYNYSGHEAIYLASEIGMAGTIKSLAYYKATGNDVNPIEAVSIYMKHTSSSTLTTGAYSLTGYTLVYSGAFPNTATSGWMEVNFSPMFTYNGTQNLSILVIKGYQAWISDYPYWSCSTAANRARQERNDNNQPTTLSVSNNLPNLQLKIFPAASPLLPPQNLEATVAHHLVQLNWDAPSSGSPTGYRIFRNSIQITQTTSLSYTDNNVTNNLSYTYYVLAVYGSSTSDPSNSVNATPLALPPVSFTASPGNGIIALAWQAPALVAPTAYRIYRDDVLYTTESGLFFNDVDVQNGTSYSYYLKAMYDTEESTATPTLQVTPYAPTTGFAILGTESNVSLGNNASPINTTYRSSHGQSIYTAAELNALGVYGPIAITQLGFYIVSAPTQALPNFLVRMKHTTATSASDWQTAVDMITVYTNASYSPSPGGYDMLAFNTPFVWNGVDNIVVDTAFGLVPTFDRSGTIQYTNVTNGYIFTWSDSADQTNVFFGSYAPVSRRPNIRISVAPVSAEATISVSTNAMDFGSVVPGETATQNFSVQNSGEQLLAGYFLLPNGYSVSASRGSKAILETLDTNRLDGTELRFALNGSASASFELTFAPTAVGPYNGTLQIISNAVNAHQYDISLSGTGGFPTLDTPTLVMNNNAGQLILSWNAIPNAVAYQVYRSATPDGEFALIGTTTQLQYTVAAVNRGFYYIKATTELPTRQR